MTPEELVKILNAKTTHSWSIKKNTKDLKKFEVKATKNYVSKAFFVSYEVLQKYPELLIEELTQKAKERLV